MSDLIDRRQAIKAIDDLPNCYNGFSDTYDKAYIIGVLEELPPAAPRWHRVEEELPDDTRDVLAVRRYGNDLEKQEVIVAHLSVIMEMERGFDKWWNATNITHWMPLPEPPKEDEYGN